MPHDVRVSGAAGDYGVECKTGVSPVISDSRDGCFPFRVIGARPQFGEHSGHLRYRQLIWGRPPTNRSNSPALGRLPPVCSEPGSHTTGEPYFAGQERQIIVRSDPAPKLHFVFK